MSTATLNGIVYLTRDAYNALGANADPGKVYIVKEEMATAVNADTAAAAATASVPATTNAIWSAILSASGATYTLALSTDGTVVWLTSPKPGIANSSVAISAISGTASNLSVGNSDKLDGQHASEFALSGHTHQTSATLIGTTLSVTAGGTTSSVNLSTASGTFADLNAGNADKVDGVHAEPSTAPTVITPDQAKLITGAAVYSFVTGKLGSVYIYKGSKDMYTELPTTNNIPGDVWNVISECTVGGVTYGAGTNFAWAVDNNVGHWDPLGGNCTLAKTGTDNSNLIEFTLGGQEFAQYVDNVLHSTYAARVGAKGAELTNYISYARLMQALTITNLIN